MTNSTTPKMTKAQKFALLAKIPAVANDPVLSEFVAHEMELLANKKSSPKKPTTAQKANEVIKEAILDFLSNGERYTISELMKFVPNLPEEMTPQRMTALVTQLKNENLVERIEDKRKAYFKVVEG